MARGRGRGGRTERVGQGRRKTAVGERWMIRGRRSGRGRSSWCWRWKKMRRFGENGRGCGWREESRERVGCYRLLGRRKGGEKRCWACGKGKETVLAGQKKGNLRGKGKGRTGRRSGGRACRRRRGRGETRRNRRSRRKGRRRVVCALESMKGELRESPSPLRLPPRPLTVSASRRRSRDCPGSLSLRQRPQSFDCRPSTCGKH